MAMLSSAPFANLDRAAESDWIFQSARPVAQAMLGVPVLGLYEPLAAARSANK